MPDDVLLPDGLADHRHLRFLEQLLTVKPDQHAKFMEAARELGCDEDEAAFDDKLKRIARHKPPPDGPKKPATKKPGQ